MIHRILKKHLGICTLYNYIIVHYFLTFNELYFMVTNIRSEMSFLIDQQYEILWTYNIIII